MKVKKCIYCDSKNIKFNAKLQENNCSDCGDSFTADDIKVESGQKSTRKRLKTSKGW